MNQLFRLAAAQLRKPDLALEKICDVVSFGGNGRRMAFSQEFCFAAFDRNGPYALLDALRGTLRIGIRTIQKFEVASSSENNRARVWRPAQLAEVLAVVIGIGSDLLRFVISVGGRFGNPRVAAAQGIENPGYATFGGRGGELRWKGRTGYLFQQKRFLRIRSGRHEHQANGAPPKMEFHRGIPPRLQQVISPAAFHSIRGLPDADFFDGYRWSIKGA